MEKSTEDIFGWANAIYLNEAYDFDDWYEEGSLSSEIMSILDTLYMSLIIIEDAIFFIVLLDEKIEETNKSINKIQEYLNRRNMQERIKILKFEKGYTDFIK